jgi:hypothetical protein
VERGIPTIAQFNHAIAVVERPQGRLFVDLTAAGVPWGALPTLVQGQFALVVHRDGRTEETVTPEPEDESEWNRLVLRGSLDTAGYADLAAETILAGETASMYHGLMTRTGFDSAGRTRFVRGLASRIYPEAEGDSLRFTDETEVGGNFTLSSAPATAAPPGSPARWPFCRCRSSASPLVPPQGNEENHLRLELPAGWRAELPKNVALSGPFGELSISYAQQGRVLEIRTRRVAGKGVLAPRRIGEVITWLEQVAEETREAGSVVLHRR